MRDDYPDMESRFNEAWANGISLERIAELARERNKSAREVMLDLLARDIWPRRFIRNRGILSAAQMGKLLSLNIFMAGCGGLGGQFANQLARMGAGRMRVCDPDVFEESNLNRQLFCTEKTLGKPKATVVKAGLLEIASHLELEALEIAATKENLPELLRGMDVAVDCLDSTAGKKMLEEAAANAGIAFLHGSVLMHEGFVFLDMPGGATLRAMYPEEDNAESQPETLASSVCAIAALMSSLLITGLAAGGFANSGLIHLDCSAPEIERFVIEPGV